LTEAEWLACDDPKKMLAFLRGRAGERKVRLFAVACCRRAWHLLADERSKNAVRVAEEFADGVRTGDELLAADRAAASVVPPGTWGGASAAHWCCGQGDGLDVTEMGTLVVENVRRVAPQEAAAQAGLLRCLFGNPLRPVTSNPSWLTPSVTDLTQAAYEHRHLPSGNLDPARLAVLADALEEAGGTDEAILSHLRGSGPHVRGCWAVDRLLGKG
jgi:hypothetical protein